MKVVIFANTFRLEKIAYLKVLFDFFSNKDVVLLFESELYDLLRVNLAVPVNEVQLFDGNDFHADLALSIGGDGTFLNTASRIGDKSIPILGINTGRLGFLADVPSENIFSAMDAYMNGKYVLEERTLLEVQASDGLKFDSPFALNELAILKQDSSSMIAVDLSVDGEFVNTYQADGLLVSTPTGSTAYSLSVGGPIVMPQSPTILIAPVATHSLNVRPLIIPDKWTVELEVKSRSQCYQLSIDGRSQVISDNTKLKISKARFTIKVLKPLNQTYFDTLKHKLMWGLDRRNS